MYRIDQWVPEVRKEKEGMKEDWKTGTQNSYTEGTALVSPGGYSL